MTLPRHSIATVAWPDVQRASAPAIAPDALGWAGQLIPNGERALVTLTSARQDDHIQLIGDGIPDEVQISLNSRLEDTFDQIRSRRLDPGLTVIDGVLVENVPGYICFAAIDLLRYRDEEVVDDSLADRQMLLRQVFDLLEQDGALPADWYVVDLESAAQGEVLDEPQDGWWRCARRLDAPYLPPRDRTTFAEPVWIALDQPVFDGRPLPEDADASRALAGVR